MRHTYSTFEGDMMKFSARVAQKSLDPSDPWVEYELEGKNQEDRQILTGRCQVILPCRPTN